MSFVVPSGAVMVTVSGTPVAVVGSGFCMYTYAMKLPWSTSEIAGVPRLFGEMRLVCVVTPGDWSVTVPWIRMGVPCGTAVVGAVVIVAVCPLPNA